MARSSGGAADAAERGLAVELVDVVKTFRTGDGVAVPALDHVALRIPAGQAVAVTGPSGSGKSTLLHLVGSMDRPDSGAILVGGRDVAGFGETERTEFRRRVGFVFQKFHLLPALTVLDNVIAPVLPYRTAFDKKKRARELLAAVGLGDRTADLPGRLSGGQQQRVAIARALINDPGIVLADEPTGALDSHTGGEVMDLLLGLRADRGLTLLIATHDLGLAGLCDRRISLKDGCLVADEAAVRDPGEPAVAALGDQR